jgi:hypothetical protein
MSIDSDAYYYLYNVFYHHILKDDIENFHEYNKIIKKYLNINIEPCNGKYKVKEEKINLTYLDYFNVYYLIKDILKTEKNEIIFGVMWILLNKNKYIKINEDENITDVEFLKIQDILNKLINVNKTYIFDNVACYISLDINDIENYIDQLKDKYFKIKSIYSYSKIIMLNDKLESKLKVF